MSKTESASNTIMHLRWKLFYTSILGLVDKVVLSGLLLMEKTQTHTLLYGNDYSLFQIDQLWLNTFKPC